MANITLAGTLRDPNGDLAVGDKIRFTHKSTTGETVKSASSILTIDPTGVYSIYLEYGLILVEYKDARNSQFENLGVATVNGTNPATTIPELLNALVPVSSAELIEFQAILADCVAAKDAAETAAATLDLINDLSQAYIFDTVALFKASLIEFPDDKTIYLRDRDGRYKKITGTLTANDRNVIAGLSVDQSISYIVDTTKFDVTDFMSKQQILDATNGTAVAEDHTSAFRDALAFPIATDFRYINIPPGMFYRIDTTTGGHLNIVGNTTIAGLESNSHASQTQRLVHSGSGDLFNLRGATNGGAAIRNLEITGGSGDGGHAILSNRPDIELTHISMNEYNNNGITLESDDIGVSSSYIGHCRWIGPNSAVDFHGISVSANGGDVTLFKCGAIRGARGISIRKGQTIKIDQCSVNKQSIYNNFSSATPANTFGIGVTGLVTDVVENLTISNSYIEACTRHVVVDKGACINIENNLIADVGVSGNVGVDLQDGNSLIQIGNDVKTLTAKLNTIWSNSNGTVSLPFYCVRVASGAENVTFEDNRYRLIGDNSAYIYNAGCTTFASSRDVLAEAGGSPLPNFDPDIKIRNFDQFEGISIQSVTKSSTTVNTTPVKAASTSNGDLWKVYMMDSGTAGAMQTEATVQVDLSGVSAITYQVQAAGDANLGEVTHSTGNIFVNMSTANRAIFYSCVKIM